MELFSQLLQWSDRGLLAEMITLIDTPEQEKQQVGQMMIYVDKIQGCILDSNFTNYVVSWLESHPWNHPEVIELVYKGKPYRLFRDRVTMQPNALVLGAGHISQPLVLFLSEVGFTVTVIDDRPDFASTARFPKAKQVICQSFRQALLEVQTIPYSVVIIVTRGHRYDLECLRTVLDWPVDYLGMIGSQRRVQAVKHTLEQEGIRSDKLLHLRAPIGLDLGGQSPSEIALAIVAEIIGLSKGGSFLPLCMKSGRGTQNE